MTLYACPAPCGRTTTSTGSDADGHPVEPTDADGGLPVCHICKNRVVPA